ncbi:unnamed protein product [Cuscuta campestris]|uniref:Uncharacterized protein n=1 Tax=Cuscuta campestris TaxID=132261 RepID=A0A484KI74_9ASTE|nr:unnamed protein product [Cuscuta campestris]
MGACASKPKDLDSQEAAVPEAPLSPKKPDLVQAEDNGEETTMKEAEPLVDLADPAESKAAEEVAVDAAVDAAKPAVAADVVPAVETTAPMAAVAAVVEEDKAAATKAEEKKEEVAAEVVVAAAADQAPPVAA